MIFEGIYTPIISPLKADCSIDFDGLSSLIDFLVESHVHGIIVGGTTGEYYALSHQERRDIMTFIKSQLRGRLPMVAGVGAIRTEESIELALYAKSIGAEALLVGSPYYAVPTEIENAQHALSIDQASDLPIMLCNYPGRTGADMGTDFLDLVAPRKNFRAIKESSGNINKLHLLVSRYPSLQLSCGAEDQALEFFSWGARSWVCGGSNFLPAEHLALYEACVVHSDFNLGRKMMLCLLPFMQALEQGGKFVQYIKYGCEEIGLKAGPVRKPLRTIEKEMIATISDLIVALKAGMKPLIQELKQKKATTQPDRLSGYA